MMKRDVYAYITTLALTIAFGFSVFLIVSDNILPFTTQATVKTMSIDVVPEVSGYIQTIYVKEGQQVHPGERLFDIDPTQYQIARDKAQASFLQAKNQWTQAERHLKRVKALSQQALTSQETLDDALTNEESSRATFCRRRQMSI
ncbi:biotin/lipoyl-binding protein [Vibrio sp. PP-XX7]